jgi:hypothetical protein
VIVASSVEPFAQPVGGERPAGAGSDDDREVDAFVTAGPPRRISFSQDEPARCSAALGSLNILSTSATDSRRPRPCRDPRHIACCEQAE